MKSVQYVSPCVQFLTADMLIAKQGIVSRHREDWTPGIKKMEQMPIKLTCASTLRLPHTHPWNMQTSFGNMLYCTEYIYEFHYIQKKIIHLKLYLNTAAVISVSILYPYCYLRHNLHLFCTAQYPLRKMFKCSTRVSKAITGWAGWPTFMWGSGVCIP